MNRLILLVIVSLLGSSLATPTVVSNGEVGIEKQDGESYGLEGRIVGGYTAPIGAFPYQVSLRRSNNIHFCGGSIINNWWILTAAHCVRRDSQTGVYVVVGTNTVSSGGTYYQSAQIVNHPHFNNYLQNDIALIRVNRPISFNYLVSAISLPTYDIFAADQPAIVSGWGALAVAGPLPNYLQYLYTRILDHGRCMQMVPYASPSSICTLLQAGQGNCFGDSGGPLVVNGVQVGIVSRGAACALGKPDIYTRVYSFLPWIRSFTG